MHTPQNNPIGYDNTSIHDMQSLSKNVRFLVMHGVADDNVHTQSTYTLIDKLDLAGVSNYDVHVFPDSDHSIYFHNANKIVYQSKCCLLSLLLNPHGGVFWMFCTDVLNRTYGLAYQCFQWRVAEDGKSSADC
jgi:dipeptidyl aminopeptidase